MCAKRKKSKHLPLKSQRKTKKKTCIEWMRSDRRECPFTHHRHHRPTKSLKQYTHAQSVIKKKMKELFEFCCRQTHLFIFLVTCTDCAMSYSIFVWWCVTLRLLLSHWRHCRRRRTNEIRKWRRHYFPRGQTQLQILVTPWTTSATRYRTTFVGCRPLSAATDQRKNEQPVLCYKKKKKKKL